MTRRRSMFAGAVVGTLIVAALPRVASAHLVTTGLGPVYDGISHLLLSPDDLLPVIALALLAGLRGPAAGRQALFVLPVAWLAGGIGGLYASGSTGFPVPAISLMLLGILVASDLRVPNLVIAVLATALGFAHGGLDGTGLRPPSTGVLALIGMAVMLFVLIAIVAGFIVTLRRPWQRIVVRVGGSWLAAIGLLLLGWALHGVGK